MADGKFNFDSDLCLISNHKVVSMITCLEVKLSFKTEQNLLIGYFPTLPYHACGEAVR